MRQALNWLARPLFLQKLSDEELTQAKKHVKYLQWRAEMLGISVPNEEERNGR